MYDYNFLEEYKIKKKKIELGTRILLSVFLLVAIIIGGISAYTYYINDRVKSEITALEKEINKPSYTEDVRRLASKQVLLKSLSETVSVLQVADASLMVEKPINEDLFKTIVLALPSDTQIDNLTVNQEITSLNGVAAQRSAIAEFEKTLREAEWVQDVYVSNIRSNSISGIDEEITETNYTFDLTIEMGGGMNENIN